MPPYSLLSSLGLWLYSTIRVVPNNGLIILRARFSGIIGDNFHNIADIAMERRADFQQHRIVYISIVAELRNGGGADVAHLTERLLIYFLINQ